MKVEILRSVEPRTDVERQIGRLVTVKFNIEDVPLMTYMVNERDVPRLLRNLNALIKE